MESLSFYSEIHYKGKIDTKAISGIPLFTHTHIYTSKNVHMYAQTNKKKLYL